MIQDVAVELQKILHETRLSSRWTKFQSGTNKEKIDLSYNVPMGYFSDDQHELILKELMEMMPNKDNESTEIVLKVLFPETLIRIFTRITNKTYKEAEAELFRGKVR